MSRSRKHTPIGAITTATSEKRDKQLANRRLRAAMRSAVAVEAELLSGMREVSDPWTFDKDGKTWRESRGQIPVFGLAGETFRYACYI